MGGQVPGENDAMGPALEAPDHRDADDRSNVFRLASEIRAFMNQSRWHQKLFRTPDWGPVAASLDWLTYTQEAIDGYARVEAGGDRGQTYLAIFGLFDAFIVQQDAARELGHAVGFNFDKAEYKDLMAVREMRIAVAGHPTRVIAKEGRPDEANFVIEATLTPGGFELITVSGDETRSISVSIYEHIMNQQQGVERFLAALLEFIVDEDRKHREEWRGKSLSELFPTATSYHFEKIILGATSEPDGGDWLMAKVGLNALLETVASLERELAARGLDRETYPGVAATFREIEYPLQQLRCHYLAECDGVAPDPRAAQIFGEYLQTKFEELADMAIEIDEEYRAET